MNCSKSKLLIDDSKGQVTALPQSAQEHIRNCVECSGYAEDLEFGQLLLQSKVPPASLGFTDRALQQAWSQREDSDSRDGIGVKWAYGVAACLLLATSVALNSLWPVSERDSFDAVSQVVQVIPNAVSEINLLMVSQMELPEAEITLRMDDNVTLAGYAGSQVLSWSTAIASGNNQLTLPVQLQGSDSGSISVEVQSNGASKEMRLTVNQLTQQRAALFVI